MNNLSDIEMEDPHKYASLDSEFEDNVPVTAQNTLNAA